MGGRSGQGVVRNATNEPVRQPALSDEQIKTYSKELGKRIDYNGDVITLKDAVEQDLITDKSISIMQLKNGDLKIEYDITLKGNKTYTVPKNLQQALNVDDSSSDYTKERFKKLEPYLKNNVLKREDYIKLSKQGISLA